MSWPINVSPTIVDYLAHYALNMREILRAVLTAIYYLHTSLYLSRPFTNNVLSYVFVKIILVCYALFGFFRIQFEIIYINKWEFIDFGYCTLQFDRYGKRYLFYLYNKTYKSYFIIFFFIISQLYFQRISCNQLGDY